MMSSLGPGSRFQVRQVVWFWHRYGNDAIGYLGSGWLLAFIGVVLQRLSLVTATYPLLTIGTLICNDRGRRDPELVGPCLSHPRGNTQKIPRSLPRRILNQYDALIGDGRAGEEAPSFEGGVHVRTCRCTLHLTCVSLSSNGSLATHQVWTQSAQPFARYGRGVCTCARADALHLRHV